MCGQWVVGRVEASLLLARSPPVSSSAYTALLHHSALNTLLSPDSRDNQTNYLSFIARSGSIANQRNDETDLQTPVARGDTPRSPLSLKTFFNVCAVSRCFVEVQMIYRKGPSLQYVSLCRNLFLHLSTQSTAGQISSFVKCVTLISSKSPGGQFS